MAIQLPSVGHVIQYGFPYSPTALQALRQLQLTLAAAGARQTAYGNRRALEELTAPAPTVGPPPPGWVKWKRIWGADFAVLGQRRRWRGEEGLIFYDPAHYPAIRSHRWKVFVAAGPHWDPTSRRVRDRFRRFLNQLSWQRSACVVATETRWLRTFGLDARAGEFRFRSARPGVWHIPPFVDGDLFHPDRGSARFQALNPVLFVGEMTRGSGFYLAAETFRRFAAAHEEATFVIVGGPGRSKRVRTALSVLERPGLAGRTLLLGDVPEAALPEILASARMAIFPLFGERDSKISALQAMACGAATLSTSTGGLDDLPTIKFEPTIEGLLQSMETVWPHARETGLAQSQQTRSQFALANWESAWLDLLQWLLARSHGDV